MAQQKKNVGLGRGLGALISGSMLKHAQSAAFKNKEKHASSGPKKNVPETKKPTAAVKPAATTKKTAVPAKKNVATPKISATPTKKTAAHATTKPSAATTKKNAAGTKSVAVTKKSPEPKAPTKKTVSATKPSATKPSVVKPVATKKSPEPKAKKIAHAEPKPSAHAEPEISAPEEKISASEPREEVVPAAATPTETVLAESTKTVPADESASGTNAEREAAPSADAVAEREAEPSAESGTETTENSASEPSVPSESVAAESSEPSESVAAEPSEPSASEAVAPAESSSVASASEATVPASESVAPSAPKTVSVPPLPFVEIFVEKIVPAPHQSRRVFEETSLRELAESIRAEGLLQPIVVREIEDGKFELIAGERRWRAFRLLKLPRIPARIVKASDASSAAMTLIENLQREDLNPIEEAFGIGSLMRDFNLTQDAVAERVGKARSSIANALRLLSLDAEIQGFVASGILSVGHAKVLLSVVDPTQRLLLARRFVETQCSVRAAEALARRANEGRLSPRDAETEPIVRQLSEQIFRIERELCSHFHTKVLVKNGAKSGKILIEYRGNDELSRLLDCFGLHGLI